MYIYIYIYIYSHIRWRERERDSHIIMGARGYWISQVSQSTLGGRSQLGVTLMNGDYEPTQTSGLLNADTSAARCTYKCNEQIWDTSPVRILVHCSAQALSKSLGIYPPVIQHKGSYIKSTMCRNFA